MLENSVTIKAETVEKAVKMGLSKLNATEQEVEVNVITEGKKGLFGFGRQDAIITMTKIEKVVTPELEVIATFETPQADIVEPQMDSTSVEETFVCECGCDSHQTEQPSVEQDIDSVTVSEPSETVVLKQQSLLNVAKYLEDVLEAYGAPAKVTVESAKARFVTFSIETEFTGRVIGKHGKTIDALQTLAQVMVQRDHNMFTSVMLNVGDYRDRRAEALERIAKRTAREVLRTKNTVVLDPLPAYERKQIHSHLSKMEHITTHSEGVEPNRYLIVEYVN